MRLQNYRRFLADQRGSIGQLELFIWAFYMIGMYSLMITFPYGYQRFISSQEIAQRTAEIIAHEANSSTLSLANVNSLLQRMQDYGPSSGTNIRVSLVRFNTGTAAGSPTNTTLCFSRVINRATELTLGSPEVPVFDPLTTPPQIPDLYKTERGVMFVVDVRLRVMKVMVNRAEYRRPITATTVYYKEDDKAGNSPTIGC